MSAATARMPDLVEAELRLLSGTIARSSCTLATPLASARSTRSHQNAKGRSSEAPQTKNVAGRAARFRIGMAFSACDALSSSKVTATGMRSPRFRARTASSSSDAGTTR